MIADFWNDRIKWGLRGGFIYVCVFGGFAVILRILDGGQSFQEHDTSLLAFLEAYSVAGFIRGQRPLRDQLAARVRHSELRQHSAGL